MALLGVIELNRKNSKTHPHIPHFPNTSQKLLGRSNRVHIPHFIVCVCSDIIFYIVRWLSSISEWLQRQLSKIYCRTLCALGIRDTPEGFEAKGEDDVFC